MTRKIFASLLAALMLTSCAWGGYYDEGHQGLSEGDAYVIDSYEDLYNLQLRVNSGNEPTGRHYRLTNNITINADSWSPIGGASSSSFFTGHFNGDGNIITTTRVIFGVVNSSGTAVTNLHVNGDINVIGHFYGSAYALSDSNAFISEGGVAAFLLSGTIEDCDFEGTITKEETLDHATAGGIVGYMKNGTIKNCTVNGKITAGISGTKTDYFGYAGGIVGCMKGGTIQDCTVFSGSEIKAYSQGAEGTTSCESYAGGVVGYANGSIAVKNNKVSAVVNSKQYAGGITGYASGGTLQDNKVLTGTQINANYSGGGITGHFGGTGYCQSNDIAMDSLVYVVSQAAGGIVGRLASGTVRYNNIVTQIDGGAKYKGKLIGEITGLNYSVYGNTYNQGSNGAEYLIGYDKKTSGPSNTNPETQESNQDQDNSNENSNTNNNDNTNTNNNTNTNENVNNVENKVNVETDNTNENKNDVNIKINNNVNTGGDNDKNGGLLGTVAGAATGGGCNSGFSLLIFAGVMLCRSKRQHIIH